MASTGRPCAAILGEGDRFAFIRQRRVAEAMGTATCFWTSIFLCSRHMYILKATVSRCCRTFGEEKLACNKMADILLRMKKLFEARLLRSSDEVESRRVSDFSVSKSLGASSV